MATVRKLITKLKFEADTSQADKFERRIERLKKGTIAFDKILKRLNRTSTKLKAPKVPPPPNRALIRWQKFRRRFKLALLKIQSALDNSKIGPSIRKWGKRARKAITFLNVLVIRPLNKFKNTLKTTFTGILSNIKKNRFALVAAAAAAVAAIKTAIGKAATEQDLDISIKFFTKSRSVKAINDDIARLRDKLKFGQLFTDIDIKSAVVQSLEEGIDPTSIKKLLEPAIKIAGASGKSLSDVLSRLTSFSVRGGEETLTPLGLIDQAAIEAIKKAEREAGKLTNSRKLQIVLALALNKEARITEAFQERLLSTTTKVKQVGGEVEDVFKNIGTSIRENTNAALDETIATIKDLKSLATGDLGLIDFLTGRQGAISKLVQQREIPQPPQAGNTIGQINIRIDGSKDPNATAQVVKKVLESQNLQTQAKLQTLSATAIGAEAVP